MRTATIAIALAAALLLAGAPGSAKPTFAEQNDRLVLGNELVVVDFQGKKPQLHVRDATNASRGYTVFLQRLVEVPPGGALRGGDVVAEFKLTQAAAWQVNHTTDADGVHLTLHREGPMDVRGGRGQGPAPLPPEVGNLTGNLTGNATGNRTVGAGNASVTITFHLYERARQLQQGNVTVNVTAHEVKFDLAVERWDWVAPTNVLALEFLLVERGGGDATDRGTTAPPPGNATEGEVAVTEGSQRIGWVGWVPTAEATRGGNTTTVQVEHRRTPRGEPTAGEPEGAKHWLVYQAPGFDALVHDPSVGIEPTNPGAASAGGSPVPGPGALALLLAVPAAALLARRRRAA